MRKLLLLCLCFFSSFVVADNPVPNFDGCSPAAGSFCESSWGSWSVYFTGASSCFGCPPGKQVCPTGFNYSLSSDGGLCAPDTTNTGGEQCPDGQAFVNGQCMICLFGETDGECNQNDPPDECPSGQSLQGYVNGNPVCNGQCEGAQSWGSVNGVEGCYGSPSCSSGYTYGSINGTSGCWPEVTCDSLGQCGSGSDSSSGSNTSSGSGGGDGGSNTSSGSGSGGGGDDGGGSNSGGGGSGNNSAGYVNPPGLDECPIGMYLGTDRICRTPDDNPECILPDYHYILVDPATGAGICVPDNPQPSSSAQASFASASSANSASNNSSGNTSAGNGSGSGSSAGSGTNSSQGAGECDPTSKDYLECISPDQDLTEAEQKTNDIKVQLEDQVNDGFDYNQEQFQQNVNQQLQSGVPFKNEPNAFKSALLAYFPQPATCNDIQLNFPHGYTVVLRCSLFETFKLLLGWFLSVLAAIYIWSMATAPVDR